jgi:uncharacterized membrane protein YczE
MLVRGDLVDGLMGAQDRLTQRAGLLRRHRAHAQLCHPGNAMRLIAPIPRDRRVRRGAQLLAGVVLYGVTASMLVLAGLGLDPWDILHQGLSRTFGLGIGTWAVIVSFVILLAWWPLSQRPGLGTVINALVVGIVIDLVLSHVHPPHTLWARWTLLIVGVAGNGLATGLYIGAGLGPGPRDGLSVGIAGRGHSMRIVRTSIEATVLATGFLLGGTVGIGTVLYALAIGPITHITIPGLAIDRPLAVPVRPPRPEAAPVLVPGGATPRAGAADPSRRPRSPS